MSSDLDANLSAPSRYSHQHIQSPHPQEVTQRWDAAGCSAFSKQLAQACLGVQTSPTPLLQRPKFSSEEAWADASENVCAVCASV